MHAWWPDGRVQRLTPDGFHFQACVHPEGRDAVWWGAPTGLPRIWRSELHNGVAGAAEAIGPIGARHAAYGLTGDRIVFAAEPEPTETVERTFAEAPGGNPLPGTILNLFTMAPDGSDVRPVTSGAHQDQRPCLSPDGSTAVFVSDRDGLGLYRVATDGDGSSEPEKLDLFGYRPWFAVDGRSLFFFAFLSAERRQVHRFWLDTHDTHETPEPLANDDEGWTHGPYAEPTGASVLCHSSRGGGWGLYELPLDGAPARRLRPPGFDDVPCGHVTRSRDGVTTFDAMWQGGMR